MTPPFAYVHKIAIFYSGYVIEIDGHEWHEKTKEQAYPVTLHTDQGSVYSSAAFFDAHKKYNIIRSMSRAATPTDNPKIESINGWIKTEMYAEGWHKRYDTAEEMVAAFVEYYNTERPAYALNYKSPIQYKTEETKKQSTFLSKPGRNARVLL